MVRSHNAASRTMRPGRRQSFREPRGRPATNPPIPTISCINIRALPQALGRREGMCYSAPYRLDRHLHAARASFKRLRTLRIFR